MNNCYVILAAGGGRRMGGPKGLLDASGISLVVRHVDAATRITPRVAVVVGAEAEAHRRVLAERAVALVENPAWATTHPIDSLRLAVRVLTPIDRCFVAPVDTPPALEQTLDRLLAAPGAAVPVDATGAEGHPALVDAAILARLDGPCPDGLRGLLRDAPRILVADPDVARDADDPAAWARWGLASERWRR